jgi:hypothetical protein
MQRSPRSSSLGLVAVTAIFTLVCTLIVTEEYRRFSALPSHVPSSAPSSVALAASRNAAEAMVAEAGASTLADSVPQLGSRFHPPSPCPPSSSRGAEPVQEVEFVCETCPEPSACPELSACPLPLSPPLSSPPPPQPPMTAAAAAAKPPTHRDPPKRLTKRPARRPPPELEWNECIEVDPYSGDLDFPPSAAPSSTRPSRQQTAHLRSSQARRSSASATTRFRTRLQGGALTAATTTGVS